MQQVVNQEKTQYYINLNQMKQVHLPQAHAKKTRQICQIFCIPYHQIQDTLLNYIKQYPKTKYISQLIYTIIYVIHKDQDIFELIGEYCSKYNLQKNRFRKRILRIKGILKQSHEKKVNGSQVWECVEFYMRIFLESVLQPILRNQMNTILNILVDETIQLKKNLNLYLSKFSDKQNVVLFALCLVAIKNFDVKISKFDLVRILKKLKIRSSFCKIMRLVNKISNQLKEENNKNNGKNKLKLNIE